VQLWVPVQAVHWVGKLQNKVNGKLCSFRDIHSFLGNDWSWPEVRVYRFRQPLGFW
jgi:hypothetical protein